MKVSALVVSEFCALCDWAYQACQLHRSFFDDNPDVDRVTGSRFGYGFGVLSGFTLEYSLLQIVKLHDKSSVAGRENLTVDYILNYGEWAPGTLAELERLATQLRSFASNLRHVRNKALSHNDLPSILEGGVIGGFEGNEDVIYFENLGRFADIISREIRGAGFAFNPFIGAHFKMMASALAHAVDA
ncbi:hypothetical protein [Lysobacter panacisoli]|uniref:HEPN AbiU2-like domain-containing protein n=1 Tax=Lysobacter panacisoli TaxID=1255263 RepID=A0ABP9LAI3_9GAMM|nr:hypothetical protein [Lysobacter panacisoli]